MTQHLFTFAPFATSCNYVWFAMEQLLQLFFSLITIVLPIQCNPRQGLKTSQWYIPSLRSWIQHMFRLSYMGIKHMHKDFLYPDANHGAGICTPTFARTKSPSFVRSYIPAPWSRWGMYNCTRWMNHGVWFIVTQDFATHQFTHRWVQSWPTCNCK